MVIIYGLPNCSLQADTDIHQKNTYKMWPNQHYKQFSLFSERGVGF